MRKHNILIGLIIVIVITLLGCAMLQIGQPQLQTFELTIDGQKVVVNLPKEFPSMDQAIYETESCWDAKLCMQSFCLSDEPLHEHVRFFYSGKDVVALMWCPTAMKEECRHWLYAEGLPTEVEYERLKAFLDSLWKKVPNQ